MASDWGNATRHPIRGQLRATLQDDSRSIAGIARLAGVERKRLYNFLDDRGDLTLAEIERLGRLLGFCLCRGRAEIESETPDENRTAEANT